MKTGSLWIIRVALTVQFLGVLAVPALVAADEAPRGVWLAEWLNPATRELALGEWRTSHGEGRPESNGRAIGVLQLRERTLSFVEQIGQVNWQVDLARVKKVATVNPSTSLRASGKALLIELVTGEQFVFTIMGPDFTPGSPRRALNAIERAIESQTANGQGTYP